MIKTKFAAAALACLAFASAGAHDAPWPARHRK